MKLLGVHWVLVAASLAWAGPPPTEPDPVEGGEVIGVVWHDQATVPPAIQQRLVDVVRGRGAGTQVVDAVGAARAGAAADIERGRVALHARWDTALVEATASYRAGELEPASAAIDALLQELRAYPGVPGASRLAWRAHVLRAQLSRTEGDTEGVSAALVAAIALDPAALPSTREVPPAIVEAYRVQRVEVRAAREHWSAPEVSLPAGASAIVEIDGVVGSRAVPPGEHWVVVHRVGVPSAAATVSLETAWVVPQEETRWPRRLPETTEQSQTLCDEGDLDALLLVRRRGTRLAVQRHACGEGLSAAWYQGRGEWEPVVVEALAETTDGFDARPVLHLDDPWPAIVPAPTVEPPWIASDGGPPRTFRTRFARAVPWVVITGVVGGIVTAVVLIRSDRHPNVRINGDGFLNRGGD